MYPYTLSCLYKRGKMIGVPRHCFFTHPASITLARKSVGVYSFLPIIRGMMSSIVQFYPHPFGGFVQCWRCLISQRKHSMILRLLNSIYIYMSVELGVWHLCTAKVSNPQKFFHKNHQFVKVFSLESSHYTVFCLLLLAVSKNWRGTSNAVMWLKYSRLSHIHINLYLFRLEW